MRGGSSAIKWLTLARHSSRWQTRLPLPRGKPKGRGKGKSDPGRFAGGFGPFFGKGGGEVVGRRLSQGLVAPACSTEKRLGCPASGWLGYGLCMTLPFVLVTGFGPFGEVRENPSGLIAEALGGLQLPDVRVAVRTLPVTFADAPTALRDFVNSMESDQPCALLSLGVHPKAGFRLERLAKARPTSAKADTMGAASPVCNPTGIELRPREASFDLEAFQKMLPDCGVQLSSDAGGYVCDWVYQHLLAHGERLAVPALFLHVPPVEFTPIAEQIAFVQEVVRALVSESGANGTPPFLPS